jgi:hypothetical protein
MNASLLPVFRPSLETTLFLIGLPFSNRSKRADDTQYAIGALGIFVKSLVEAVLRRFDRMSLEDFNRASCFSFSFLPSTRRT